MSRTGYHRGEETLLSVVITVVDGGVVLRRFLDALQNQIDAPRMELLLPFDGTEREVASLQPDYPNVRFIDMGTVSTIRPVSTAAGQHELYDRRRAAALHHAQGNLVAILEDRAPPRSDWAATMTRLHRDLSHGVIGGAIACAPGDLLNWSFWACDFGRYGPTLESGPRRWISDVNVCYKRRCMDMTRDIWRARFNEARVHWALLESGETLYFSREPVVDYHTTYNSLRSVLPERFHWGRLFGSVRAGHMGPLRRIVFTLAGPLIPFLLFFRHRRLQERLGNGDRFRAAAKFMFPLLCAWTTGEVYGYITRRP
jgi:hypothetical protein